MSDHTPPDWRLEGFPMMADLVPAGATPGATVDHFEITDDEAKWHNVRCSVQGDRFGHVVPGRYARLVVRGHGLMMTDTPMERLTNREVVRRATGHVLIAGLGLGMILHPILAKPDVRRVDVLELSADVIALVAPTLAPYDDRVHIHHADALTWAAPKGETWDVIYFDIWPEITEDNLPTAAALARRYGRRLNRANPAAWMGGWRIEEIRARRNRERRTAGAW